MFPRMVKALAAAAATALLLVGPIGPAAAHDTLISSDPADATVLTSEPAQIVLTFSADQLQVGAAVAVTGPDGAEWTDGEPVVEGPTVTQALAPEMVGGAYAVEWRSVSSDGHPISGAFGFTLELPATEPGDQPGAEPGDEPGPGAGDELSDEPSTEPSEQPAVDTTDEPVDDVADEPSEASDQPWLIAGIALAVIAGVATVIVLLRRRRGDLER